MPENARQPIDMDRVKRNARSAADAMPITAVVSSLSMQVPDYRSAIFAWIGIEHNLGAARVQVERIASAQVAIEETRQRLRDVQRERDQAARPSEAYSRLMDEHWELLHRERQLQRQAIADVQYYLTCWHMINRYVFVLMDTTKSPAIEAFARRQHAHLKRDRYKDATPKEPLGWYGHGRDHFAHFEERIPGAKWEEKLRVSESDLEELGEQSGSSPGPILNLRVIAGDTFLHPTLHDGFLLLGKDRWDVSPGSFDQLTRIVDELAAILRQEYTSHLIIESIRRGQPSDG